MKKNTITSFIVSIVLSLVTLLPASCQAANGISFEGRISNLGEKKVILNRVQGHREIKVFEMTTDKNGHFKHVFNQAPIAGQYRLRLDPGGRNAVLEFLIAGQPLSFVTDIESPFDSIKFSNSPINEAWYAYFRLKDDYETRLGVLEQLMNIYPRDERFYPKIIEEFGLLQNEMDQKVSEITSAFPNTILASYVRSDRSPRINPNLSPEERQEFIRYNYLNNLDFTDTLLLNTDIFPNKSLSFIMLFRSQRLNREQQAEEFIKATDLLLPLAMIQPQVYNYLLEYTISGFEQIGMESVLMHIAENYPVDESCKSDHDSGELQRRIEGYRKLASGKPAPLFKTNDINDQVFDLAALNAEHTLIVFWASWCPHCTSMLPQIKDMAARLNAGRSGQIQKLSVVSVSIDHAEKDYMDYLVKNNLNTPSISGFWVNINDYKAWDGPVADAYYLYATPTMVLLDKDKNIISKPSTIDELNRFFNR